MFTIYVITCFLCTILLCYPIFFMGERPWLKYVEIQSNVDTDQKKRALVQTYIKAELAFEKGLISEQEWLSRKTFLQKKFLDLAKQGLAERGPNQQQLELS